VDGAAIEALDAVVTWTPKGRILMRTAVTKLESFFVGAPAAP